MSLALLSNTYVEEHSAKIRSKPVPWEGYQRANHITVDELAQIKRVDRQQRAKIDSILLTDGQLYAVLYLKLLKKLARVDTMSYVLVFIADALLDHDERVLLFIQACDSDPDLPYGPLLSALETHDEFVQLKACQILTTLISCSTSPAPLAHLTSFLNSLSILLQSPSPNSRDLAVLCLESLLPRPEIRKAVWEMGKILPSLVEILKSKVGAQMHYQVIFCLWLLTFESQIASQINRQYDVIPLLTTIAQNAVKEKVIRVVVATFRNLVAKAASSNLPAMLVCKLLPFVNSLSTRKWSDDEIVEDIKYLQDELKANFQSLTTYDEYTSELASGHLSWTPVHDSAEFWKENAMKLNDKEFEQLKVLVSLLKASQDPLVLAVAAHDIGQYVKYYDRGKKVIQELGAKTRVMELMTHENADVRYQALISVQRLVSQPWA